MYAIDRWDWILFESSKSFCLKQTREWNSIRRMISISTADTDTDSTDWLVWTYLEWLFERNRLYLEWPRKGR